MSHTNRNFVVAYTLLVGLPLLGLAGVLRSGRNITAPISIDGTWKIDTQSASAQACAKSIASLNTLLISQSGKSLQLSFNGPAKTLASGSLEGKNVKATIAPDPSACTDQYLLAATVDPTVEPRSLTGTFAVSGCATCTPIEFHALRQPRPPAGGTH